MLVEMGRRKEYTEGVETPMQDTRVIFEQFHAAVQTLLLTAPKIHSVIEPEQPIETVPGWRELCGKPRTFAQYAGKPVLVAVLFGPSGAGKSTVFRLLTGIDVPAGNVVRPVSHSCAVAVPRACAQQIEIGELFPDHTLEPLTNMESLRDREAPEDRAYWAAYDDKAAEGVWLVLADVPDFNTVCKGNWAKAERMLARAEIVIFLTYPEAYVDHRVVQQLERCCRHAGHMAYVFVKQGKDDARQRWANLLERAYNDLPQFAQKRADGRTLAQFLGACPVYYSEHAATPELNGIQPLCNGAAAFDSLMRGRDGARILLSNLLEIAKSGIASCRDLCDKAAAVATELSRRIERINASVARHAEVIAGTEFPAGRLLELIIEVARASRPRWVRLLFAPLSIVAKLPLAAARLIKSAIVYFKGPGQQSIQQRETLERERLAQATESMCDEWRAAFPDECQTGHALTMSRCSEVRSAFLKLPLPKVHADWENAVRSHAVGWIKEHPWRTTLIGSLSDILVAIGGAAIVLDLCVAGGTSTLFSGVLLSKLGIIGAAGAGCAGASILLKLFEEFGLGHVLHEADAMWRAQRQGEFTAHIRERFARPLLLGQCETRLAQLTAPVSGRETEHADETILTACRAACATLEQLGREEL